MCAGEGDKIQIESSVLLSPKHLFQFSINSWTARPAGLEISWRNNGRVCGLTSVPSVPH